VSSGTRRCFIACALAPESAALLTGLRPVLPGIRWIEAVDLHVTLRFLGNTDSAELPAVLAAVGDLEGAATEVTTAGLGGFPTANRARALVVHLASAPILERWQVHLARRFGPDARPFLPHVTIGRSRKPLHLAGQGACAGQRLRLEAPALFESRQDDPGRRYHRIDPPGPG
jgi:2'-5' RNA ligase